MESTAKSTSSWDQEHRNGDILLFGLEDSYPVQIIIGARPRGSWYRKSPEGSGHNLTMRALCHFTAKAKTVLCESVSDEFTGFESAQRLVG